MNEINTDETIYIQTPERSGKALMIEKAYMMHQLETLRKERDAAIADLTEFAMFHKRQTICNFCMYDAEEECKGKCGEDNQFINKCFKWRGAGV